MTAGVVLTDDELIDTVRLIEEFGVKGAARQLGIAPSSVRHRREEATRRNLCNEYLGGPLPPGRILGKVTVQYGKDGEVLNEWQRQVPTEADLAALFQHYVDVFKQEVTPLPEVHLKDLYRNGDWLAFYPIVDVHLGQHSWKAETGANYNLKIAVEQFKSSVSYLMASTPSADTALIVILGDFYHADNNEAQTKHHHNHLDVDGRHDKVAHVGIALIVWMIDMSLQKHVSVIVHVQRGNHDEDSHRILKEALWWRYQDNPRVKIDISPEELWTYEFGQVMLSFTHGDQIKAQDMPGVMAANASDVWGRTKYRFGYSGHWHRNRKGPYSDERNGARWEILPAFTEKDAYNIRFAKTLREMCSIIFDKHDGKVTAQYVTIK